jgi:hypothetical protein
VDSRLYGAELHAYLVGLAGELEASGQGDAAAQVTHVSKFASGSMSELFAEASVLLLHLARDHQLVFSPAQRFRLEEVLLGIESEFERIGGA